MSSIIAHGDAHQRFFELAACGHQFEETFACFDCYLQFSSHDGLKKHLALQLPGNHRTVLPNRHAVNHQVDQRDDMVDCDDDKNVAQNNDSSSVDGYIDDQVTQHQGM